MIIDSRAQLTGNIGRCPKCMGYIDLDTAIECPQCKSVICTNCGYCHCPIAVQTRRAIEKWAYEGD